MKNSNQFYSFSLRLSLNLAHEFMWMNVINTSCDLSERENISTRWCVACKNEQLDCSYMLFFCASKEKCRNITTFHHAGQGGPGDTLIRCACIIIPKIITLLNNFTPNLAVSTYSLWVTHKSLLWIWIKFQSCRLRSLLDLFNFCLYL